jgi:predicted RNase H-like nuclease (RuvC/YqgF family)
VQNIIDALQKHGVKKAAADRSLASLMAKGTVNRKEYGKINVFILAQDKLDLPDPDEIARVDAEIKELTEQIRVYDSELDELRGQVVQLQTVRTVEEARAEIERLDKELAAKEEKLGKLGDGSNLLSKDEKVKVELEYFKLLTAWKKRKRLVRNIADTVGESSGMKPAEFYEKVGVETDEDVNANIADFPNIENPAKKGSTRPAKRQRSE